MQSKKPAVGNISSALAHEHVIVSNFNRGYRNREDITILPPGILVKGSQNFLTNVNGRVALRQGYTLDGQSSTTIAPIDSSFDWTKIKNNDRHLRSGNNNLEFRYINPVTNNVEWTSISSFSPAVTNYTTWWNPTELTTVMLFVDGSLNMWEWSGGVASFASATATTLTKSGTTTWAQEGFYTAGTRSIVINGVTATYSGGENTNTLTGVSVDFSATPVGTAITQGLRTFTVASFPGIPGTFKPNLISTLVSSAGEQLYLGNTSDSNIYISRSQNYQNYTQVAAGPRAPGDGAIKTITGYPTAFIVQEQNMYISAGTTQWYESQYSQTTTSVSDGSGGQISTIYETLDIIPLQTTYLQAAQSQAVVTKIKNKIAYLSFEPIINTFGPVTNVYQSPQIDDVSYSIVNDMNNYDFTDSSMIYFKQYLYLSIPKEGIIRVYNMTDSTTDALGNRNHYWEAPQTIPVGRFSIIDDALYGHGYQVPETYKLFSGTNDNGADIHGIASFSFNNFGTRTYPKNMNEMYVEGYISPNTTLTLGIVYDIDGCATYTAYELNGNDEKFVCIPNDDDNSLGKQSLGKYPLGLFYNSQSQNVLPPKFRWIKTFPPIPFYEEQTYFEILGKDCQFELLAFGPNATAAKEGNNSITD